MQVLAHLFVRSYELRTQLRDLDAMHNTATATTHHPTDQAGRMDEQIHKAHPEEFKAAEDQSRVIVDDGLLLTHLKNEFPEEVKAAIEKFTIKTRSARSIRSYWKKERAKPTK